VAQALENALAAESASRPSRHPAELSSACLILNDLFDWSYDYMEREVRRQFGLSMFTLDVRRGAATRRRIEDRARARPLL